MARKPNFEDENFEVKMRLFLRILIFSILRPHAKIPPCLDFRTASQFMFVPILLAYLRLLKISCICSIIGAYGGNPNPPSAKLYCNRHLHHILAAIFYARNLF